MDTYLINADQCPLPSDLIRDLENLILGYYISLSYSSTVLGWRKWKSGYHGGRNGSIMAGMEKRHLCELEGKEAGIADNPFLWSF